MTDITIQITMHAAVIGEASARKRICGVRLRGVSVVYAEERFARA